MGPLDPLSSLVSPCDTSFVNFMSFDSSCGTALEQRGGGEQNKLGDRFNRTVGNRNRAVFFPKVKKPCGRWGEKGETCLCSGMRKKIVACGGVLEDRRVLNGNVAFSCGVREYRWGWERVKITKGEWYWVQTQSQTARGLFWTVVKFFEGHRIYRGVW